MVHGVLREVTLAPILSLRLPGVEVSAPALGYRMPLPRGVASKPITGWVNHTDPVRFRPNYDQAKTPI
jgi:hypothetical protein